ncbi:MAG: hypothetical protein ACLGRW_01800 [Acidobacteriota bacterium]
MRNFSVVPHYPRTQRVTAAAILCRSTSSTATSRQAVWRRPAPERTTKGGNDAGITEEKWMDANVGVTPRNDTLRIHVKSA